MVGIMRIGIDDTDSPDGMCTTYLGAVLIEELRQEGYRVSEALLVRLNPNVPYKTRGNAAICLEVEGDPARAFALACDCVEELADFSAAETNPGVVVAEHSLPVEFYHRAVTGFCTTGEAIALLDAHGVRYRGYKNGRGLIGAAAAVGATFSDATCELLAYRRHEERGERIVDRESVFAAEYATYPHTWDSVDRENGVVVCVPHTPDPVLFGIRGESPAWVRAARAYIRSQEPVIEQVYRTNQGTDAHLVAGRIGEMEEGWSYLAEGSVTSLPRTGRGGHVAFDLANGGHTVRCMAYEPTKGFRDVVRQLVPGDGLLVAGSYRKGSVNLEKMRVCSLHPVIACRPPVCEACGRRMTSAGAGKGYKCRECGSRSLQPEISRAHRDLSPGWYEVPPSARRHLAKPLVRFTPAELAGAQGRYIIADCGKTGREDTGYWLS
jgi:tRNA(Ile2)-agmatinylcytidine synthase